MDIDKEFPNGLLSNELFLGAVSSVSAAFVRVNLSQAGMPSGMQFLGGRYGRGEVGEFVLIEGQVNLLLGRIIEVKLPERDRQLVSSVKDGPIKIDAFGTVQLLGAVRMDDLTVIAGASSYPRLGDKVYAAPVNFICKIPSLICQNSSDFNPVLLRIGKIDFGAGAQFGNVDVKPEVLFGRHCAILGTTGGGKSWTTARLIEECIKHKSKIILLDATGEYCDFHGAYIENCYFPPLGNVGGQADNVCCSLPPNVFAESDFSALFRPSPGIQAPKFREALVSLRAVYRKPAIGQYGYLPKANRSYDEVAALFLDPDVAEVAYNPNAPFDVTKLIGQIERECVWENEGGYGRKNDQHWGFCSTLIARISNILNSNNLSFVFNPGAATPITEKIRNFLSDGNDSRLLRISMSGVSYEFQTREILANTMGRFILATARAGLSCPVIIVVDEAHNFIGRQIGQEDFSSKLDAFEIIAKEGRKYGVNICLSTQRPRDITESVLSQMGTLIVHRLTNDRDREVVERACGEIDKSASSFLPNLKQGEVVILGTDFPIPMTVQIDIPSIRPQSDGPNYQQAWV